MSMQSLRLESRVRAQEEIQMVVNAQIVELAEDIDNVFKILKNGQNQNGRKIDVLSQDMAASFKQLARYQNQTERKIDERFNKIEEDVAGVKADLNAVKEDVAEVKADLSAMKEDVAGVKATMATKEDIVAVKGD